MRYDGRVHEVEDRFLDRMTEIRKARRLSQEWMARSVSFLGFDGFPQSAISKFERAGGQPRRILRLSEALAIAHVLGEDFEDMACGPLGENAARVEDLRKQIEATEAELTLLREDYRQQVTRKASPGEAR
jgi:transcriptional regulator with XRE-family HTH domain